MPHQGDDGGLSRVLLATERGESSSSSSSSSNSGGNRRLQSNGQGGGGGDCDDDDDDDDDDDSERRTSTCSSDPLLPLETRRGPQIPECLAHLSAEERTALEARLKRKIDARLMPALIVMYILNYIDRNNIAAAKLAGLQEELGLSSFQYETAVSVLFFGYLLMQVPSNLLLNKIGKPAIYLPSCMIIWGAISTATAACRNPADLYAVRFLLGFVEAAYFPGCLYFLSCWYTRKELGLRTSILYSGALLSGAFSGLISAAIKADLDGYRGLRSWRWLFLIEGVVTIGVAFSAYFVLPDFPRTTSWLTNEERQLAVWRLEEDVGQDDWVDGEQQQSFWHGAKLAFLDVKTYILTVMLFCIVSSGSVTNFFPTVVQTLGYNDIITLLLTAPPYVLAVVSTLVNAWHADKTGERYRHVVLPLFVAMGAFILAASTTSLAPRYIAMMLMISAVYSSFVVVLAWISNTIPRPPAKRAAALALINAFSNTSSIYASYLYPDSAGPRYTAAFVVNSVTAFLAVCAATALRAVLVRLNGKLDAGVRVEGAVNGVPGMGAERGFRFKV